MSGKYSNIKVVSFDMDGTILNTEADLEAAARRALKLAELPPMPPVRFANYIGNGVKGIYRELCPDADSGETGRSSALSAGVVSGALYGTDLFLSGNVGDSAVDGCQRNPAGNCDQ